MMPAYTPDAEDREALREPHGTVVQGDELIDLVRGRKEYQRLITVGDRVSRDLAGAGMQPDIAVVDGKIEREAAGDPLRRLDPDVTLDAANPPGGITEQGWARVRQAVAHTCTSAVVVDGEEDLLALPAIANASPDSLIVHGHWEEGAVVLEPGADLKAFVNDLVGHRTHDHVIVGGSWDRFHAGHRYILLAAFEAGTHVDIGITDDDMLRDKIGHDGFDAFDDRKRNVRRFLDAFGLRSRARTLQIDDFRGNAVEEGDALMVTDDTRDSAERINQERRDAGREPLDLLHVDRIRGPDNRVISSTRLRANRIDRDGRPREDAGRRR